jgi:hypothetical protein
MDVRMPGGTGPMRNRGAASSRRLNSAMCWRDNFRRFGPKVERLAASLIVTMHASGGTHLHATCVSDRREMRRNDAWRRTCAGAARLPFTRPASDSAACHNRQAQLTWTITKLRFPIRKTRPSVKTVITLGLRKNAPDENRCREGDAYSAQIRQSRCHCAGISFV